MSTITFAGNTLWSDSTTGVGQIEHEDTLPAERTVLEPLPGGGYIAQQLGLEPDRIVFNCSYNLDASGITSLRTTLSNLRRTSGTLTLPGQSYTGCIMLPIRRLRGQAIRTAAGTYKYTSRLQFTFQKITID